MARIQEWEVSPLMSVYPIPPGHEEEVPLKNLWFGQLDLLEKLYN